MREVTLEEARDFLAELIRDALQGEEIIISETETSRVRLVPVRQSGRARQPGTAQGQVWMSDDFNAPMEDFESYTR